MVDVARDADEAMAEYANNEIGSYILIPELLSKTMLRRANDRSVAGDGLRIWTVSQERASETFRKESEVKTSEVRDQTHDAGGHTPEVWVGDPSVCYRRPGPKVGVA